MDMRESAALVDTSSADEFLRPDNSEYRAFLEAKIAMAMPAGLPCELGCGDDLRIWDSQME